MGFRVKIITPSKFGRTAQLITQNLSDRQLRAMANTTTNVMKRNISDSIKRADSSGNLENAITFERFLNGYGVGVIDFLNTVVPYWRHVNFGSIAIGASHSHKVPVGGFNPGFDTPQGGRNNQRWFTAQGGSSFIPSKPIAPLNYIEKTLVEVPIIINTVLRTVR